MKNNTKSITEISTLLSLPRSEIYDRLRIIGGYSGQLAKGSAKAQIPQEDIEYISDIAMLYVFKN